MHVTFYSVAGTVGLALALARPAPAQALDNDGFRRRNGLMQVVRNGQPRPMTRDAHLPTGATVTKDGFVVGPTGQRTELREGQGCDLRGRPVAVLTAPDGTLALERAAARVPDAGAGRVLPARTVLEEVFGRGDDEDGGGFFGFRKGKKHHGKGKGRWK